MDSIAEQEMRRDGILQRAAERAVQAADHIILEVSDGSLEETRVLTVLVADLFVEKIRIDALHALLRKRLEKRAR